MAEGWTRGFGREALTGEGRGYTLGTILSTLAFDIGVPYMGDKFLIVLKAQRAISFFCIISNSSACCGHTRKTVDREQLCIFYPDWALLLFCSQSEITIQIDPN